jgi:hypothetical protein
MPNLFDRLQARVFDTAGRVMGYDAVWTRESDGQEVTGRVLFKEPTEKEKLAGGDSYEYTPRVFYAEYRDGVFPGLFDSARQGISELLEVAGNSYIVIDVQAKFDGRTFVAKLQPKEF